MRRVDLHAVIARFFCASRSSREKTRQGVNFVGRHRAYTLRVLLRTRRPDGARASGIHARHFPQRRCSGVIQLGHGERAALMQAGGELFQTVSHGVRGDGNLPFFGFALLGNEKMFRCDDADVSASGSGCIVVQVSLADFPVLPGHVGRHGRHDYPVFRRYSGYPDGLADVFHGYLQLTVFFSPGRPARPGAASPCRSAINEKADAQRTSVSQYRTVTRLCFVQEL